MAKLSVSSGLDPVLAGTRGHLFAVVDGIHGADLARRLRDGGLNGYAIRVEDLDLPGVDEGPFAVPCADADAIDRVQRLTGAQRPAMWWMWPQGGMAGLRALAGHLRRLNLIDVPEEAPHLPGLIPCRTKLSRRMVTTLFRHADPEVIAALLPVLSARQLALLFGAARAMVVTADGAVPRLVRPSFPGLRPPTGRLALSGGQHAVLAQACGVSLRRQMLREFSAASGDAHRAMRILDAVERAESYGFITPAQARRFVRMDLRNGCCFEELPRHAGVLAHLTRTDLSPTERLFHAERELLAEG